MLMNRSAPHARVVPVLMVADVRAAVAWYTDVFGFVEHVQDQGHAQLGLPGGGELIVGEVRSPLRRAPSEERSLEIMLKVDDAAAVVARATQQGGKVVRGIGELRDLESGERHAMIDDVFGHRWVLTQTLVDTAPEQWGGKTVTLRTDR